MPIHTSQGVFDVKAYGAKGDGIADDTAELQAAQDAVEAAGGGRLYLPAGVYLVTSPIQIGEGVIVIGAGNEATIVRATGVSAFVVDSGAENVGFEHLGIDGNDAATTYGIHFQANPRGCFVRSCKVTDFGAAGNGAGIFLDGGWGHLLDNVLIESCGRGIVATNANAVNIVSCIVRQLAGHALVLDTCIVVAVLGGVYEKASTNFGSGATAYGIHVANSQVVTICGAYLEENETCNIKVEASTNVNIDGCISKGTVGLVENGVIYLAGSDHCTIRGCQVGTLDSGAGSGVADIYLDTTSDDNVIIANRLEPDGAVGAGNEVAIDLGARNIWLANTGVGIDVPGAVFSAVEVNGALDHDGTTVGFYGVAPTARPSAYTQTYATADKTHAARTAADLTDSTGETPDTTIAQVDTALTDITASAGVDTINRADLNTAFATRKTELENRLDLINKNLSDIVAQINKLRADQVDTAQVVNSVVDDLQALGLLQ